jgi:D-sedoheptulose 7-phosphate isomerase
MNQWIADYIQAQKAALDSISVEGVAQIVRTLQQALKNDQQIFVFGNGGSAANASHFATDLGKGASDVSPSRFRILSLNDNTAWMTALGNDYSFEDVFLRQIQNYARPGDLALCMSVSGNSPNLVKAMRWARDNGLVTVALVGAKRGGLADIVEHLLVIPDTHYGRVEDAQMTICHMLSYAFMEAADGAEGGS